VATTTEFYLLHAGVDPKPHGREGKTWARHWLSGPTA